MITTVTAIATTYMLDAHIVVGMFMFNLTKLVIVTFTDVIVVVNTVPVVTIDVVFDIHCIHPLQ